MVQDSEVHRLADQCQPPCDREVAGARRRVSGGMIVREYDCRGPVERGIGDDLAKRQCRRPVASVDTGQVNASSVIVDVGDPQMLTTGIAFGE